MKQLLTALLIAFLVFGCKERYADCDRQFKDSSVGFMISGELGNSKSWISIVKIVDRKDWKFNQYFYRYGFSSNPRMEQRVPIEDSCSLKRLYFKIFERPKPSPLKEGQSGVGIYGISHDRWVADTLSGGRIWIRYAGKDSTPKPSPLPDTTKPLNIKMQTRWRDEITDLPTYTGTATYALGVDSLGNIIEVPHKLTDMLLVCDTSQANGFLSNRIYWIYGYAGYLVDGNSRTYLDQEGKKLPKNIVVFLSKELK